MQPLAWINLPGSDCCFLRMFVLLTAVECSPLATVRVCVCVFVCEKGTWWSKERLRSKRYQLFLSIQMLAAGWCRTARREHRRWSSQRLFLQVKTVVRWATKSVFTNNNVCPAQTPPAAAVISGLGDSSGTSHSRIQEQVWTTIPISLLPNVHDVNVECKNKSINNN